MVSAEPGLPEKKKEEGGEEGAAPLPAHLLARLAHDIRSPLGLLSGALEEIREGLASQLDEGQKRMLSLAERGLVRLDRMAKTLSTVAQIEGGTLMIERVPFDLARIVREVVESVQAEDPRRGLDVTLELAPESKVPIDPERVREALWELVSQARRQAKTAVRIALADKGAVLELRIEDDGRSLDATDRKYAFDRLYEPPDRRGTGFGLSVARDLIRAHGGDIELCEPSLPGARPGSTGTCYRVTLPR